MSTFCELPEFERELKKLLKKYPSLLDDIEDIKPVLLISPTGIGKNFTIISNVQDVKIVKVHIHCESLHARSIRLIYAYHQDIIKFMFIELYFKGDKEREDTGRWQDYLKSMLN